MTNFKNCTACGLTWQDRNSFLSDPDIELTGYQTNFDIVNNGLFLFNHRCGKTLPVPVKTFAGLYEGPKFKNILSDSDNCPGYCLDGTNLNTCGEECKFAFAREVMQLILKWRKGE